MKRRDFLAGTAATGTVLASGLATQASAAEPLKVGFIYLGVPGDGGWTYEHEQARLKMVKHFGNKIETKVIQNVPEGADAERSITQLCLAGCKLIFTTSFGYMDPTINVAKKFPNVKFEMCTGYKDAPNVSNYGGRFYQGRAVIGNIAGHMTKTNKIGYIATFPIPEVVRGINSAFLYARKVNPKAEMKVVWVNTWFDPPKEADAAQALIDSGVDVLMQHTDSTAAMAKAKDAGILAFGQDSDMMQYAPKPRISSIMDNWAPYYIQRAQDVMDGKWTAKDSWLGIDTGIVQVGEISSAVPAAVKADAMALHDRIKAGTEHVFTGPLNKQDGSAWLKAGETASDGALLGMNFYVEGMTGKLPS
ncbi:BMP family ABC transporter substrate-binding protein [Solirhodobacter olei]|uniref:BMP family ABC transporter substrate-binding protein n=1 Tax=Solirhodobacter olei TaxID=2493082 RepID=UPI000FD97942|nr:BMP family ABC transporter substrate-binding protein [Solirhodobacter olei]